MREPETKAVIIPQIVRVKREGAVKNQTVYL
jgi:hypothetical protein